MECLQELLATRLSTMMKSSLLVQDSIPVRQPQHAWQQQLWLSVFQP